MKFRWLIWLATILGLILCADSSFAKVYISPDAKGEVSVQSEIYVLEDKTGNITIDSITDSTIDRQFVLNKEGKANYGYSQSTFWIKLTIAKSEQNKKYWYLIVNYHHMDRVEFFKPTAHGSFLKTVTGDSLPFSQRPKTNRKFVFDVSPNENGTTYYIRLSSQGAIDTSLTLIDRDSFEEQEHNFQLLVGLYLGALLIMAAFNLLFLFFIRERIYVFYAGFVFFVTLYQMHWFGFAFEYLWPNIPELNNLLDIFTGNMLFTFLGLFTMDFLQTRKYAPRFHKLFKFTTLIVFLSGFTVFFMDRAVILGPTNNVNIIQMILVVYASINGIVKRVRQAYIFAIAWTLTLFGGLSIALYKIALLPEMVFVTHSAQIGILANVLLISIGLADRINDIKNSLARSRETVEKKNRELMSSFLGLETSEKRFRDLSDLLPQTVFELDREGKVTYSNEQGHILTGYTQKDLDIGFDILNLIKPSDHDRIRQDMIMVLESQDTVQGEYEILRKDGTEVPVNLYASRILSNDEPVGIRGVAMDLSQRKKTEEVMMQTEKMMSLGGLAAGMAHEINNPLAGMIQNAQVLSNRLTKDLPANQKAAQEVGTNMESIRRFAKKREIDELVENIRKAGNRASKIVNNMLSFARKGDSVKRPNRLDTILDDTLELAQNDFDLKKNYDFRAIEIKKEYKDLPTVLCERSKLQQVILNIVKNASEAISMGEDLKAEPWIKLSLSIENVWAVIKVADNGPGMDKQVSKKIFEPFFTTKGLLRGTGLGLSVSYFIIVDEHQGEMTVDSNPGEGTVFTIKLPIDDTLA